ncbi:uncharacterized protein RAG0_12759 [Rhynchosporium agropyri]|uniref:Lipocalin/cytosolic fatty-acid binding domain-containing protein n=1 Tax=Rhynchosporium agropyri TaxID=914238 RepID=A0A1E1LA47_9HELO|nr:uncharacterized protein RAG0_12759 [Rhynchosporium agropyri]
MLLTSLLVAAFLPALASGAKVCTSSDLNVTVTEALWDGQCTYPKADKSFQLSDYLGRWYQVAGTRAPFTAGCSCIYAEYGMNARLPRFLFSLHALQSKGRERDILTIYQTNNTVSVSNGCQLGNRSITIEGTASPADEIYGSDGVFRLQFPGSPGPECPGPNYIVQKRAENWVIVQASNFSTLFLLSRNRNPDEESISTWLDLAGKLGSDLSKVIRTNQIGCLFTGSSLPVKKDWNPVVQTTTELTLISVSIPTTRALQI